MSKGQQKFDKVMHEWGQGKLRSSTGYKVKYPSDQAQALAIAYSEARSVEPSFGNGGQLQNDEKATGGFFDFGRPNSAIARDKKYLSQEPHEQAYAPHRKSVPHFYKSHAKGGKPENQVKKLYDKALDLLNKHINNGGSLDFSEKEYGYLNDDLDYVKIGYFNEKPDGDHEQELADENYKMSEKDAIETLQHRIESIESELNYAKGGVVKISEDDFFAKYKPQINHIERKKQPKSVADADVAPWTGTMYETYGEDLEYIYEMSQNPKTKKRVWTLVEGDDGNMYILSGYHHVNRQGYFITEKEWKTGTEEVEDFAKGGKIKQYSVSGGGLAEPVTISASSKDEAIAEAQAMVKHAFGSVPKSHFSVTESGSMARTPLVDDVNFEVIGTTSSGRKINVKGKIDSSAKKYPDLLNYIVVRGKMEKEDYYDLVKSGDFEIKLEGGSMATGGEILYTDFLELDEEKLAKAKYHIAHNRGIYTVIDNKTKKPITSFPTQASAVNYIKTNFGGSMATGGLVYLDGVKHEKFKTNKALREFINSHRENSNVQKIEVDYQNRIYPTFDTWVRENGKLVHKGELFQKNIDMAEAERKRKATEENLNRMMGMEHGGQTQYYANGGMTDEKKKIEDKIKIIKASLLSPATPELIKAQYRTKLEQLEKQLADLGRPAPVKEEEVSVVAEVPVIEEKPIEEPKPIAEAITEAIVEEVKKQEDVALPEEKAKEGTKKLVRAKINGTFEGTIDIEGEGGSSARNITVPGNKTYYIDIEPNYRNLIRNRLDYNDIAYTSKTMEDKTYKVFVSTPELLERVFKIYNMKRAHKKDAIIEDISTITGKFKRGGKVWIAKADKKEKTLRNKAMRMGLIKGENDKLTEKDLNKIAKQSKGWKKRVEIIRAVNQAKKK